MGLRKTHMILFWLLRNNVFILSNWWVSITFKQGSICETRAGPNRSQTQRGMFFVDFKYSFYENRYFGKFDNFQSGIFDQNSQKTHLRAKTFHLSL